MSKLANLLIILGIIVIINSVVAKKPIKSCTTSEGKKGKCVPLANCVNGTIITNGDNMVDPRFENEVDITERVDSECTHYLEECCILSKIKQNRTITPIFNRTECGIRKVDGVGFSVTGAFNNEANFGGTKFNKSWLRLFL